MAESEKDFALGHDAPRKAKRKVAAKPPMAIEDVSPTVRAERHFQQSFEKRYGFPMGNVLYKAPRDRKILKTLIGDVGEPETCALIDDFFFRFDKDRHVRFLTRAGHVPDFQRCLDRLVLLRNGRNGNDGEMHERTMENRSEIAKVMRPKP